jgi:hypothetical protein
VQLPDCAAGIGGRRCDEARMRFVRIAVQRIDDLERGTQVQAHALERRVGVGAAVGAAAFDHGLHIDMRRSAPNCRFVCAGELDEAVGVDDAAFVL